MIFSRGGGHLFLLCCISLRPEGEAVAELEGVAFGAGLGVDLAQRRVRAERHAEARRQLGAHHRGKLPGARGTRRLHLVSTSWR